MLVTSKEQKIKLPDFLIVGAAKSGTTSLYYYIKDHPQIFMSKNKEPWFFSCAGMDTKDSDMRTKINIVSNYDDYLRLFEDAKDSQILGEASTSYLYLYEETINNIKKYHPDWKKLKIIIIIRNPIERAYSHFLYDVASGVINLSFEEVLKRWELNQLPKFQNYIDYGFYYNQITAYKNNFNKVKISLFEDLEANPSSLVRNLFDFLKVDDSFAPDTMLKYNVSAVSNKLLGNLIYKPNLLKEMIKLILPKAVRLKIGNKMIERFSHKPQLKTSYRRFLKEIYEEDIVRVQNLIDRDLSHWLN